VRPRAIAIGVTALVAAVAVVAILVSGDSNHSDPAPQPSLAAVTQPDLSAIAPAAAGPAAPGQSGSDKGEKSTAVQGQADSATSDVTSTCPPGWSHARCQAAIDAIRNAPSHTVKDRQCALPTKQMCEDAGRAYKQGQGNSHEVGPNECPLPTKEMCDEAGRQAQQAGVNPFK
jgi:hypothetical protein